jgi:hypothetical protein
VCVDSIGQFCNSTIVCTINLKYPDGTTVYDNSSATRTNTYYNHTLKTDTLGEYSGLLLCSGGGSNTTFDVVNFGYSVTYSGMPHTAFPFEIFYIILCLVLMITGYLIKNGDGLQSIASFGVLIAGVLTLYPGFSTINSSSLAGLATGTILIGIGLIFLFKPVYKVFSKKKEESEDD